MSLNLLYCSAGADLYATAMAVSNTEIFQLMYDDATKKVCFRGHSGTYMSLVSPSA